MTTQTLLYQRALRLLGERELSSVTENREPRHLLDAEDEDGGLITYALETGFWRFASKTEQLSSSGTSAFGLTKTFGKPSNYVHLIELSGDEHFRTPLTRDKLFSNPESSFREDQALFYSMLTTIYIRYVNKSSSYGTDLTIWPETFAQYYAALLAHKVGLAMTKKPAIMAVVAKELDRAYITALEWESAGGAARWLALKGQIEGTARRAVPRTAPQQPGVSA